MANNVRSSFRPSIEVLEGRLTLSVASFPSAPLRGVVPSAEMRRAPERQIVPAPSCEITRTVDGYVACNWIGRVQNRVTPHSVMRRLQQHPARYFPFRLELVGGGRSLRENAQVHLFPVCDNNVCPNGTLKVVGVTPLSFTFIVERPGFVLPPGSSITFRTRKDRGGNVYLEQQARVGSGFGSFFFPVGAAAGALLLRNNVGAAVGALVGGVIGDLLLARAADIAFGPQVWGEMARRLRRDSP